MKPLSAYVTAARQWLGIERFESADGVQVWAGQQVAFQVNEGVGFGVVESFEPYLDHYLISLRDVYVFGDHPNGVRAVLRNTEIYRYWVRL